MNRDLMALLFLYAPCLSCTVACHSITRSFTTIISWGDLRQRRGTAEWASGLGSAGQHSFLTHHECRPNWSPIRVELRISPFMSKLLASLKRIGRLRPKLNCADLNCVSSAICMPLHHLLHTKYTKGPILSTMRWCFKTVQSLLKRERLGWLHQKKGAAAVAPSPPEGMVTRPRAARHKTGLRTGANAPAFCAIVLKGTTDWASQSVWARHSKTMQDPIVIVYQLL